MALVITEDCVACGVCLPECPTDAIEEGDVYIIDAAKCVECVDFFDEPKCAEVCPVDCCVPA